MQYFGFDRPSFGIKTFGFGANFDPMTLFAGGKQGVWYDPSDKTSLFQDVAGTVPVTKDGDPVALMRDKSGNGNHATQSVSASRPTYQTDGILHWLAFDGVDDFLVVSAFSSHVAPPYFLMLGQSRFPQSSFSFIFDTVSNPRVYLGTSDTLTVMDNGEVISGVFLPRTATDIVTMYVNGHNSYLAYNDTIRNTPLSTSSMLDMIIGARFNSIECKKMNLHGLLLASAGNSSELLSPKKYLAAKAGVTL